MFLLSLPNITNPEKFSLLFLCFNGTVNKLGMPDILVILLAIIFDQILPIFLSSYLHR